MLKRFLDIYKTPLLVSLTLFIAVIALNTERSTINIVYILLGSLLGTFLMDLDYLMHVTFVEPEHKNTDLIMDYLRHFDLIGYFVFVHSHKDEFEKKTFHSALFQVILGLATIFVMASTTPLIIKILVLAAFVNSIYKFLEVFFKDKAKDWFWSFKIDTKPQNMYMFLLLLVAELIVSFIIM